VNNAVPPFYLKQIKNKKKMKKVSRIKKLVVAAVLLFVVGAEMQAQTGKVMRVYERGNVKPTYQKSTLEIDSVTFEDSFIFTPSGDPTRPISGMESTFAMVYVAGGTMDINGTDVTISDFYIGKYEVTQGLWEYVMNYAGSINDTTLAKVTPVYPGTAPSSTRGLGDNCPVYDVSYDDIRTIFLPRLNKITGMTFRLPWEAEWEYAARGGTAGGASFTYSGSNTIDDVAWHVGNSGSMAHEVGKKVANALGLHDMTGNVWEWCNDWFDSSYPSGANNPTGAASGSSRVLRGGSSNYDASSCGVSDRFYDTPGGRHIYHGFRLVLVP
jgi:hypothetical protein